MEAKELRLGNLVTDEWFESFKTIITVESIDAAGINLMIEDDGNWSELAQHTIVPEYKFDQLHGIPLTEEWLLKLGFKPIPHMTVMNSFTLDIGRDRVISIGCVGTPNEMIFLIEDYSKRVPSQDICVLRNFDYDDRTYVHTLQNIVFAITGKDLIYNA